MHTRLMGPSHHVVGRAVNCPLPGLPRLKIVEYKKWIERIYEADFLCAILFEETQGKK
jgi:hypothetical protein